MATIVAAVGWLAGLHFGRSAPALEAVLGLGLILVVGLVGFLWRGVPAARLAAVAVVFGLFGVLRVQSDGPATPGGSLTSWTYAAEPVEVVGRVADEPSGDAQGAQLRIAAEEIRWGTGGAAPVVGGLLATVPAGDWRYGDRVAVAGKLERPVDRDDVPWSEVRARQGIAATVRASGTRLVERPASPLPLGEGKGEGSSLGPLDWLLGALYAIKAAMGNALDRRLPAPYAALARGLLLGGTGGMPPDLVDSFRRAGLTHVVAVSGYNIALVAAALLPLTRLVRAGRVFAFAWPAFGVALFTLAVGAPASALRAALMGGLALLARLVGRPTDVLAALAVASLVMTALEPDILYDLGFLLSSLATLALVTLYPVLDAHLPGRGATNGVVRGLREAVATTLAVELLTVPLIAVTFGRFALLSVVANVLVLPVVPLGMLVSFVVALSAPLPDAVAAPLGWIAWPPLAWIIAVVETAAAPDWAAPTLGRLAPAFAWGYYALVGLLLLGLHNRAYRRAAPSPVGVARRLLDRAPAPLAVGGAFAVALTAWSGALAAPDDGTRLTVFETSGAALVRTAGGRALLFGPGADGRALTADLGRSLPFWQATLDGAVVPRVAPDTTAGLPELLRRYRVGQIVADDGAAEGDWRDAADRAGVPVVTPDDAVLPLGAGLSLLKTDGPRPSLSLLVGVGPSRVLLLGDSAATGQRALAELIDGPLDAVQLAAEGSSLLDPALRDRADPRLAIVRIRPNLPPRALPVSRPDDHLQILRNDQHGTIELILRPTGLEVRTRR